MSARVSFTDNKTGARLDGEFVADTGVSWLVKPDNKPVVVLSKTEWTSVAPRSQDPFSMFGDIFSR